MMKTRKILIIGFVWPEPKSSAAGSRMMQLIELFQEKKCDITFACAANNFEHSENLIDLGVRIQKIELNSSGFDFFISQLLPDVVLFDRFMVEEQFGYRVSKNCPNALKILNTEDLHCLRHGREVALKKNIDFELEDLFQLDICKREIASIYRCDVSLFVSDFEIELLKNTFKIDEKLLFYLPIFAKWSDNGFPDFEDRKDFVFIGNFLHEPNWDTVQYLYNDIWPKINKKLPEARLLIYGAYPSQKVLQLHKPQKNFHIKGRAENAEVVIKQAKVVLAPIRFGAGIKGKLLEAMQCGTPSVTTSIGAEAMCFDSVWSGFIENNPIIFIEKAVKLYTDLNLWDESQKKGFEILTQRFDKGLYQKGFYQMLQHRFENLETIRKQNFIGSMLQFHAMNSTKYMTKWIEEKNKGKD